MFVDSVSSLLLIPFAVAEQLKIKPEPQAKVLTMATADGRRIQAREIFLSRVRVGQFEAENVRAALLDESFPGAQPLLGLSFLERFRFELDVAQKKLTLLRLETEQPVQ